MCSGRGRVPDEKEGFMKAWVVWAVMLVALGSLVAPVAWGGTCDECFCEYTCSDPSRFWREEWDSCWDSENAACGLCGPIRSCRDVASADGCDPADLNVYCVCTANPYVRNLLADLTIGHFDPERIWIDNVPCSLVEFEPELPAPTVLVASFDTPSRSATLCEKLQAAGVTWDLETEPGSVLEMVTKAADQGTTYVVAITKNDLQEKLYLLVDVVESNEWRKNFHDIIAHVSQ